MVNRRKFLQSGLAVSAMPLLSVVTPSLAWTVAAGSSAVTPLYKVVVDAALVESKAFATEIERRGIQVERIHGDLTRFWYEDLKPRWQTESLAVGGLTDAAHIHCLELLARRHGARITYRAEHRYLNDGTVEHELCGPSTSANSVSHLVAAGATWATAAAALLVRHPHETSRTVEHWIPAADGCVESRLLVSWVITPIRAV